ncbi:MAG: toprim domain-containing protein [Bdellovibrionales bacterium]
MREAFKAAVGCTIWRDCPCCGYKNALAVTVKDGRELYHCFAGCSQAYLLAALRGNQPAAIEAFSQTSNTLRKFAEGSPLAPIEARGRVFIEKLWRESHPAKGSLVEVYLRARGIEILPPFLRCLTRHLHKPSDSYWPVMLAAAMDWTGKIHALHRTYLSPDGKTKAPVTPAKMTLGPVGGLSCHLAPAGEELAASEGIETALSVMQATGIPTWAALSAGGIRNLILPPLPLASSVIIAADADPVGMKSAQDAALLWREQGRKVRVALPPEGMDFNDVLLKGAAA